MHYLNTKINYTLVDKGNEHFWSALKWERVKRKVRLGLEQVIYQPVSSYTIFFIKKHGPHWIIESNRWPLLVTLDKVKLPLTFGIYSLAVGFCFGYADAPLGRPTASLDRAPGRAPPPYSTSPPDLGISPWETYITSSTNTCMIDSIDNMGNFKPY